MKSALQRIAREWPRAVTGLRWGLSLGLLGLAFAWLETDVIVRALTTADLRWATLAVLLSVPMMLAMAWRWSFTARCLGMELPLRTAWSEYYASVLLNSLLPGGVAGDVMRVVRQSGAPERSLGPVTRAVVVERAVGQLVLWLALVVSAASWGLGDALVTVSVSLASVGLIVGGGLWSSTRPRVRATRLGRFLVRLRGELRTALVDPRAAAVQLSTSVVALLALVGMYFACARAIGSAMTPAQALLVVPWILAATTVPLTVGGWGVRELTAAALFPLAAIPAAEGAASSVLFGVVSVLGALPGIVPLVRRSSGSR